MKFYPRQDKYKASNVSFNVVTKTAYSYDWWVFVKPIGGKIVFNNYAYSVLTRRHQAKVRTLLSTLGIKIDLEVSLREGLQLFSEKINETHINHIIDLKNDLNKPRIRQTTKDAIRSEIRRIEELNKECIKLIKKEVQS